MTGSTGSERIREDHPTIGTVIQLKEESDSRVRQDQ
jgi:hypothetical protein